MKLLRNLLLISFTIIFYTKATAQIQVDYLSFKGFSSVGFGAFFNFSVPVSDANYVTGEAGLDVFSRNEDHVAIAPVLLGYRYTLNGSGTGIYVEPNVGYSFAGTDIQVVDQSGVYADQKISGISTGIGFGYLFEPSGSIQFNLGLRYEHIFGNAGSNMFSFRISHAFIFGRRD
ncbi:MAG: hypothetical protein Q8939_18635 [Bacteroidota bacterium]|nr:hypothetical protein [Bacteroidota bacterium]